MNLGIACLSMLAFAISANAGTILFSDLGTGSDVYYNGGVVVGNIIGHPQNTWAGGFTVSGTGDFTVTQFDLGMYLPPLEGYNGSFVASIWTDSSGQPGAELGSWNLTATAQECCELTTQTGITGVTLTGGDTYFMVLAPQNAHTDIGWEFNVFGENSILLNSTDGGASWPNAFPPPTTPAFDVLGNSVPTEVPEPKSLGILIAAFVALLAVASRTRRSKPVCSC